MLTHNQVRELIRDTRYGGHVSTAAYFLKEMAQAVGKANAAVWFGHATWKKAYSAASKTLVLTNRQTEFDLDIKSVGSGSGSVQLPEGCIAEITSRVTTSDKDWDGDIVHPEGLVFDPRGAFLWMHSQSQPIGKLATVLTQNEQEARCKFLLADVPLGRDALTLFRLGALRKSIGFKILDAEPLGFVAGQNGKEVPTGFDIKQAAVLETSAVAIPANPNTRVENVLAKEYDAVRSAGVKSFESPLMRKWAETILDGRKTVVRGASVEQSGELKQFAQTVATQVAESLKTKLESGMTTTTKQTEVETKDSADDMIVKYMAAGMDDYAEGSFEAAQDGVRRSCKKYLCDKGQCSSEHYPALMATYPDRALVSMAKYMGNGEYDRKTYQLGYKMEDGKCDITDHKAVKVTPSVVEMAEKRIMESLNIKSLDVLYKGMNGGGMGVGKDTGDAETDLLDEAAKGQMGSGDKKKDTSVSESEMLKTLLVKTLTGEIETSDELRKLIAGVANHFEKERQLGELLEAIA